MPKDAKRAVRVLLSFNLVCVMYFYCLFLVYIGFWVHSRSLGLLSWALSTVAAVVSAIAANDDEDFYLIQSIEMSALDIVFPSCGDFSVYALLFIVSLEN